MIFNRIDDNDDEIEITPEELQQMLTESEEIDVDLDEFAQKVLELEADRFFEEKQQQESRRLRESMQDAMKSGRYCLAFNCAKKLKTLSYARYKDEIDACYETCAMEDIDEALVYMAEKYTVHGTSPYDPKAFPYLKRLSEKGCIHSFRMLADYYYFGIGCERNLELADKLYLEGAIFGFDDYCERQYASLHPELLLYCGSNLMKRILQGLVDPNKHSDASRLRFAELILDAEIKEYRPESAFAILKRIEWPFEGLSYYRMGECLLNGIGTDIDPIVAQYVLEYAKDEFSYDILNLDDRDTLEFIESTFHSKNDYLEAYERTKELIVEALETKKNQNEYDVMMAHNGETDEDTIYDEWLEAKELYIKRR